MRAIRRMKSMAVVVFVATIFVTAPGIFAGQAQPAKPSQTHPRTTHMTDPGLMHPATLNAKAPATFDAKFTTTKGDFVVHVTRAWAPLGADRFYNLVKHGFFTDAAFFRVVPGFMIQFGLSADPAVSKEWQSARIKDDPVTQSNKPGYVTFATAGPNTRTTQLFINYGNNAFLDSQGFSPFGEVTSGMDVVKKLYSGYGEKPDQGSITALGKPYLDKNFPNIDSIKSATIATP
ncbi:MAG TPA: peptidylprolyl isomerase [Candidatus Acidoferrales bacterium]|nr:peptidylprolyl isomerase [Candidatus Acidoferrales bacterium]